MSTLRQRLRTNWPWLRESIFEPRWKPLLVCGGVLVGGGYWSYAAGTEVVGGFLVIAGLLLMTAAFRDGLWPT